VAVAARSIPAGATLRRRRRDIGFGVGHVALTVDYYLPGLAAESWSRTAASAANVVPY
jgi:hypothetical protein